MIACGSRIADFVVQDQLGQGGMGAVFKAHQRSLDRLVAVKVLPEKFASDREFVGRFLREARATARLNHPNIVTGIEVGSDSGWYFFAMEYVEGESLGGRIRRLGRVSEKDVLAIGHAMALALAHAHAHGILHRDVKPDNILLDRHSIPKLTDLGLAKPQGGGGSLTQTGMVVGSPHYISPEQARGEKHLDGRTDIYSLGCTLYHAATGVVPFDDRSVPVILVKHLQERMPHPQSHGAELSDAFCEVLARMVARDPADRYPNMDCVAEDLGRLLDGSPPASRGRAAKTFLPGPAGRAFGRAPSNGVVRPARSKQDPRTERALAGRRGRNRLGLVAAGACAALLPILAVVLARKPERPNPAAAPPGAAQVPSPATMAPALPKEEARPVAVPVEPRDAPSTQAPAPPFPMPLPGFGPFTALFNGRDLEGWKIMDEDWRIDDGVLVGRGSHGNAWIVSHDKLPPQMDLLLAAEWEGTSMVSLDWPAGAIIVLLQPDGRVEAKRYADKQSVLIASAEEPLSAGPHVCRLNLRGEELRIFGDGRLLLTVPVRVRDAGGPKVGLFAARGKPFRIQRLDVIGSSAAAAP